MNQILNLQQNDTMKHTTQVTAVLNLPKLLVQIPYANSTKANDKLSIKKRNKFLEFLSENIRRSQPLILSLILVPKPPPTVSLWESGSIFFTNFRLCYNLKKIHSGTPHIYTLTQLNNIRI